MSRVNGSGGAPVVPVPADVVAADREATEVLLAHLAAGVDRAGQAAERWRAFAAALADLAAPATPLVENEDFGHDRVVPRFVDLARLRRRIDRMIGDADCVAAAYARSAGRCAELVAEQRELLDDLGGDAR